MPIWNDFATSAPELAAFGTDRLHGRISYLATTRKSGAPRVHPVTSIIAAGGLWVFMEPTSPKGLDLQRGSRYALHCGVEDGSGGGGEFMVTGDGKLEDDPDVRREVIDGAPYEPAERYLLYELFVDSAFSTVYENHAPIRNSWKAG